MEEGKIYRRRSHQRFPGPARALTDEAPRIPPPTGRVSSILGRRMIKGLLRRPASMSPSARRLSTPFRRLGASTGLPPADTSPGATGEMKARPAGNPNFAYGLLTGAEILSNTGGWIVCILPPEGLSQNSPSIQLLWILAMVGRCQYVTSIKINLHTV